MSKYIDAEKLIAEIERLYDEHSSKYEIDEAAIVLDKLEDFVTSLQQEQPEVDLEKEIIRYQREDMDRDTTVRDVAHHFYKLGLNARKEEQYDTK